jgi:hypothetical protein
MCCPTSSAPPPSSASRITRRRCRPPDSLPETSVCASYFLFSGISCHQGLTLVQRTGRSQAPQSAAQKPLKRSLSCDVFHWFSPHHFPPYRLGPLHCPFSFPPNHFQPSLLLYSYIKQMSRIRLGLFVSFLIYEVFPIHYADGQ